MADPIDLSSLSNVESGHIWRYGERMWHLAARPIIMGILNMTPDSFHDGGKYEEPTTALARAQKMIDEGADIIDVGGESSRPGAVPVDAETECQRVLKIIRMIREQWPNITVSIDTYKANVAHRAIEAGATIVNDIGAGRWDASMLAVLQNHNVGYVCMHAFDKPDKMQQNPVYEDVTSEVRDFLNERLGFFTKNGVAEERIVMDVGVGFGKTVEHTLQLLQAANEWARFPRPMLWGISRKSFLSQLLNIPESDRLSGTLAALAWLRSHGGPMIWRVHDVAAVKQLADLWELMAL